MEEHTPAPDPTAVRVALWRAMHLAVDPPPHVFVDTVGLQLFAPRRGWRQRPDMDPLATSFFRASVVARARFVEDLVVARAVRGVDQYVILGSGLDSFALRRLQVAAGLRVFEIDQPGHQAWKRQRLFDLGFGIPPWLRLVSVDFGAGDSWWERLLAAGFDPARPAVMASTGVSMFLTKQTTAATLRQAAALAPGSTLAMTFILPLELTNPQLAAERKASPVPSIFISFYTPHEILEMACPAGFGDPRYISGDELGQRYFGGRPDGLAPGSAEAFLFATT
jgi:methyltransferase (TIGR00027 family)